MSHSLAPAVAPEFVYKLISPAASFIPSDRVLPLSALDKADGFYHLSTSAQVPGTANQFFPGSKFGNLLILKIRFAGIEPLVKWEAAKGEHAKDANRIFPHVYGDLLQEHVVGTILMNWIPEEAAWDFTAGWEDLLYGFLHLSLFLDGMVPHNYFAAEAGSLLLYGLIPSKYSVRPISLLMRRSFILICMAATWLIQPLLTTSDTYKLYNKKEELNAHDSMDKIKREGGNLEDVVDQRFFAAQLATALQCLSVLSIVITGMIVVEASCVFYNYRKFSEEGTPAAEQEKLDVSAAVAESKKTGSGKNAGSAKKTTKKD
ncbi:unnamed protein product [Mortierella alpina]